MSLNPTTIDWPGLTHTWNPIIGCQHGCGYCYARRLHDKRYQAYQEGKLKTDCYAHPFDVLKFFPGRLKDINTKTPRKIFVGSMGDMWGDFVDGNWIGVVLEAIQENPQHEYMFLTKNPKRYFQFNIPRNCWLGVTITNIGEVYKEITSTTNKVFYSVEPLLGSFSKLDFRSAETFHHGDLVIIGAQTGRNAVVPKREWIESIRHPNIHYKQSIRDLYPEFKNKEV